MRRQRALYPVHAGACRHMKTAEWSAAASLHSSLYEFMSAARARVGTLHAVDREPHACVSLDRLFEQLNTIEPAEQLVQSLG